MEDFENQLEILQPVDTKTDKTESRVVLTSVLESERKIAAETGKFYNSLLDTYLEVKTPEEQRAQTMRLFESLPGPMKKLYGEALVRVYEELKENHNLIKRHRGDEVRYLFNEVLTSMGTKAEAMEEIFLHINEAEFIEPFPGFAIIRVEKDLFELLKKYGIIHNESHAVCFGSDNRGEPSFLMIQRLSLEKSMAENNGQVKSNRILRHEVHHLIWNFLQRQGDFLRKAAESTPELTKAFKRFRDEAAAYIIEGRNLGFVDPELLTNTEDSEILEIATDARDFATICIEVAKQKGIDPQIFLYACMSSRNFAELKDKFTDLTPLEEMNCDTVAVLYSAWVNSYASSQKVNELLERKKLTVTVNLVQEYWLSRMIKTDLTYMSDIISELENVKRFAAALKLDKLDEQRLIEQVARARLPFPKEIVDTLLSLPNEQLNYIPLNKSGEEFLELFVSFWNITEESVRAAIKKILDMLPDMRKAFNNIRDKIIRRGAELYRNEFKYSDGERRQEVETEIQERIRLLMEL